MAHIGIRFNVTLENWAQKPFPCKPRPELRQKNYAKSCMVCRSFRLSPQYPFPCSLQDALAAYLYLISPPPGGPLAVHAHNIVLYGDSSGGALALSLLIVLRDAGLPTPAGCVLLSSWVDLTHSFPSVLTNAAGDYIPAHGFHYRPSLSWPPIRGDPMVFKSQESKDGKKPAELVVKEQIQLYCSNSMISHPMVSLVNQGSLGGLPPLCIVSLPCNFALDCPNL